MSTLPFSRSPDLIRAPAERRGAAPETPVYAFDAYGTLLDIDAVARGVFARPAFAAIKDRWPRLSAVWREKQLSYSWLTSLMGAPPDFWDLTQAALDFALEAEKLDDWDPIAGQSMGLRAALLEVYAAVPAFDDACAVLRALRNQGARTCILSNGTHAMLTGAVAAAGIGDALDDVLSVQELGIFKPDPRVYCMVCDRFNVGAQDVTFVSANGWDAAGASAFGFHTVWINRTGAPMERLPAAPDRVITSLRGLLAPHVPL